MVSPFGLRGGELLVGHANFYFKQDADQNVRGPLHWVCACRWIGCPCASRAGVQFSKNRSGHTPSIISLGHIQHDPSQLPYWPNASVQEVRV